MKPLITLAIVLALTACQTTPSIDLDAETRALLAADQAFADLSEATTPKNAFATFMAPDGMMMPAASDGPLEGHANIVAAFGPDGDPGFKLLWQPQFAEVSASADMGWTWGQFQAVAGDVTLRTGKYVNVWRKQADGSWKVRVDVGNERPQPENPPEQKE
jgi:ketosteroid isomerase-like protein